MANNDNDVIPRNSSSVNILLIGLGYHAKRVYCPVMKRDGQFLNAKIKAVVDLTEKEDEIRKFIIENMGDDIETFFIAPEERNLHRLNSSVKKQLDNIINKHGINAVFICTEPLSHMVYARYALQKGLHILMDKPVSTKENVSTELDLAKEIMADYNELVELKKLGEKKYGKLIFNVMAQRRYHPAFLKIKEMIKEVHEETNCPVTSMQSFHSDGQWRLPIEIVKQDYHPYNQGYGKLSHSGYHSLDMMPWLLEAAEAPDKCYDEVEIISQAVRPSDFMEQIRTDEYRALFPDYDKYFDICESDVKARVRRYGEIDTFSTVALKHNGCRMTLGAVNLVHNGFAQRNWVTAEGRDLYKGNGRVRHETHYIEQGPFQSISFISYQGKEICQDNIDTCYDVGGEYHLDIHVFRNDKMFPKWKNHEKISIKDMNVNIMEGYSRGHQEDARRNCIIEFIRQIQDPEFIRHEMSLEDHRRGVVLMSGMYQSLCRQYAGDNPQVNLDFKK